MQRSGCWWSAQCSNRCNLRKGTQFKFLPCPVLRNLNCVPLRKLQRLLHCALHQHPDLCTLSLRWLSPAPIYGGGVSPSAIGTNTPLAHAVVSPIVTCAGGVFPSTHWRRYRTCARVTCTVWWWFFGGGGGGFLVVAVVVFWWWWWWLNVSV